MDNHSYFSKRRFLFWQNFSKHLYDLMQDFDADSAGKFVDDLDRSTIDGVNSPYSYSKYLQGIQEAEKEAGGILSFVREQKIRAILDKIDGKEV